MSARKPILRQLMALGLCVAIGFGTFNIGQASLTPKASAATIYETKVTYGVNLRTSASTSGRVIRLIPIGENINVISKVNNYWLKVKDKRGNTGYISAGDRYTNYGDSSSISSKGDRVVDIAKSYMGRVKYDFGTRNPSKLIFDCSSFTQFVFAKIGVDLKWGTKYQKSAGSFVSKSSLRKGDLVFFDTIGSNNKVINHVGIYIGNGQFIHDTPSKNGLAINSLTSGWWSNHYVTARHVL
ncbi:MAG: SH3 domain-containing C40 family peptidase [Candidatus Cohnella colombiensis]|uniref:SH3 domain-containing C40 family peptidase n=1 Tax=Candidatus Cohnella colombiensis TaxID=3121368 RepID=A0AA95EWV3_9BACL|nr:MAG: SH3 domain-containing C40 family peptidase [Cohnella sp.]